MFFSHYVADFSHTWDFLFAYQDPLVTPENLNLGIDAVSLAFLSHQVSSQVARDMGRRKYGAALNSLSKALQDPATARKPSTFQSALLFDLFEKMMKPDADADADVSNHAHLQGALALMKLRGIEQFRNRAELAALMGLECNATVHALSTGNPVPEAVRHIRKHAAQFCDTSTPRWRLSGAIIEVTSEAQMLFLRSASSSLCAKSMELDRKLEEVALEASPAWRYELKTSSGHDPTMILPNGLSPNYDVYPSREVTQMWNLLRSTRILFCEQVVDGLSSAEDEDARHGVERAKLTIISVIRKILASVPQMTDCENAARHKLPKDSPPARHTHTMSHFFDVYVLIYPLYVVAWSQNCPPKARQWAVDQLNHISEHFGIREAASVVNILRQQETEKTRADPWLVYKLLGSYAFTAA